jgi:hypothetical protein
MQQRIQGRNRIFFPGENRRTIIPEIYINEVFIIKAIGYSANIILRENS